MIVKSDKRSITGYNDVCGVHITYNIEYRTADEPENVIGQIEANDERIGVINIHRDGQMYISMDKGSNLSALQQSEIIATVIADADSVFNPADEPAAEASQEEGGEG